MEIMELVFPLKLLSFTYYIYAKYSYLFFHTKINYILE